MKYRTEIDGLRAIAVLFVILYHLGLITVGAGFAGVDVFFVISGYLIGGLILSECATNSFRFRNFFARRETHLSRTVHSYFGIARCWMGDHAAKRLSVLYGWRRNSGSLAF